MILLSEANFSFRRDHEYFVRSRKNENSEWTEPMEDAFLRLNQALTSERVVKIVQVDAPFIL